MNESDKNRDVQKLLEEAMQEAPALFQALSAQFGIDFRNMQKQDEAKPQPQEES